jgi:molybdopterin/thiamine biosynthesis adenylyltransferase
MTATTSEELSADEIALYDRQLRLWGMEAQNRMRKANILLITVKALGNEVAKNLVLAGIGSLTVLDPDIVTQSDVATQFFVTEEDIGKNVPSHYFDVMLMVICSARKHLSKKLNVSIHEFKFAMIHRKSNRRVLRSSRISIWL